MKARLAAIVCLSALTLVSCQSGSAPEPGPEMGNATPVASPPTADFEGELIEIGAVTDLVEADGVLGARVGDELLVGSLQEFKDGSFATHDVSGCTDVTATGANIAITCGKQVRVIGPNVQTLELEEPAQTAVITSDGRIVVGSGEEEKVSVYRDGERIDRFKVAATTDELLALPRDGRTDAVLRINRANTTIQDVRIDEGRQGGTLRVGIGVGTLSAGPDGIAVVSDASGGQIMIYTVDDVVRLHQTAPISAPWAVGYNGLAWAASTDDNTVTGFDISGGVPVEKQIHSTIADIRALIANKDRLILGGAEGLQVIEL